MKNILEILFYELSYKLLRFGLYKLIIVDTMLKKYLLIVFK